MSANLRMTVHKNNVRVDFNANYLPDITVVTYGLNDTDFGTDPLASAFTSRDEAWDFIAKHLAGKRVWKMVTV